jgi:DNA-binding MarR family transcriptional regulator
VIFISSVEYPLGFLLGTVLRKQEALMEEALRDLNISIKEYALIILLAISKERFTQLEAGNQLSIDRTSIGLLIDKVCQKGYISKEQKPNDRRSYLIGLTEQGAEIVKQIKVIEETCSNVCLSSLEPNERNTFLNFLQIISKEK